MNTRRSSKKEEENDDVVARRRRRPLKEEVDHRQHYDDDDDKHNNESSYDSASSSSSFDDDDDDAEARSGSTDTIGSLLRDDARQHAVAVLIAVVAALVSFVRLNDHDASSSWSWSTTDRADARRRGAFPSPSLHEQHHYAAYPRVEDDEHHHDHDRSSSHPHLATYRRTAGLSFCAERENETSETRRRRRRNDVHGLVRHQFHFSRALRPAMRSHLAADDENDDDDDVRCLEDHAEGATYVFAWAWAAPRPDVASFYRLRPPPGHAPGRDVKATTPSFTGFAAKFVNLGPHALDLWWDGDGSGVGRKIALVEPFQSVGTATHNGQSFRFSPTYDKDHALVRFVLTSDDAVVKYDPIADDKDGDKILRSLSEEQRRLYDAQLLSLAYGKDYLVQTGRHWLSNFPRPPPAHFMHEADYFGRKHKIVTSQTHFVSLPPDELLGRLAAEDYRDADAVSLPEYRDNDALTLRLRAVSCAPRVFVVENFLSDVEVEHVLRLSLDLPFERSTTNSHPDLGGGEEDGRARSSTNAWVHRETSPIVDAVYRRAADALGVDESLLRHHPQERATPDAAPRHSIAEALQLTRYERGQRYAPHHDAIHPDARARYQPTRFATLLLYLNGDDDGLEGGETTFPRAVTADSHDGVRVRPRKGRAVLFYNVLPDGNVDDLSQHGSDVVTKGEKWVANLWVWDPVID